MDRLRPTKKIYMLFKNLSKIFFIPIFCALFFFINNAEASDSSLERKVAIDGLLKTQAVYFFQNGDYRLALTEFQKLSELYPEDTLIQRYIGMTLILLGRLDDASAVLENALKKEPGNASLHYYLARAYHEQGAKQKAEQHLDEVLVLDLGGFYGRPAKEALSLVKQKSLVKKKWDLTAASGYEYDSNVTLKPSEDALGGNLDSSAGRYFMTAGGTYRYIDRPRFDLQAGYRVYQSFHDDSLNEFNYNLQDFFHVLRKRLSWHGREFTAGLRNSIPLGFLDRNLFLFGIENTAFFNTRITNNIFTEIYHKYSHYEFGPDGSAPHLLSRDGEYNISGIQQRLHFSDFRRYILAGYEFQATAARGDNFDRIGHRVQTGFHTPIFFDLILDVIGAFDLGHYPHYSAALVPREPLARRDQEWSLLIRLTYALTKNCALQAYYRYAVANNRNDLFQYARHISGTQVSVRY